MDCNPVSPFEKKIKLFSEIFFAHETHSSIILLWNQFNDWTARAFLRNGSVKHPHSCDSAISYFGANAKICETLKSNRKWIETKWIFWSFCAIEMAINKDNVLSAPRRGMWRENTANIHAHEPKFRIYGAARRRMMMK